MQELGEVTGGPAPAMESFLPWLIKILRPAILTKSTGPRKALSRTAYLDGIRGFAAFLVYWHHHQLWPRPFGDLVFENAYGYEERRFFACLPFLRTFFTGGHFAVAIFFVLSGYVLSSKPLQLIYAGDHAKLGENLASSLFRRWLRLYIPLIVTTLVWATSWHFPFGGIWIASPEKQENLGAELWNWYLEFKGFSFIFQTGSHPWFHYGFHLWSIPVEFQGSIAVFTTLLAFSRFKSKIRLLYLLAIMFYFMYIVDGAFVALFLAGTFLCELDILERKNELPDIITMFEPYKKTIYYTMLVTSLYLSGVPSHSKDVKSLALSPGWYWLSFFKPQAVFDYKWFFLFWAATFLITVVPRLPWLKAFFESRFNIYLGKISFSLYMIHGPLLWTAGDRMYVLVGWFKEEHIKNIPGWINKVPITNMGIFGFEPRFWLPHLILLPLNLWLAEITTKLVDDQANQFSRRLYTRSVEASQEK